ncbi:UNVERIFIED_CONTAM: hypothetical protein ITH36_25020, partial [Salmonella enterica subsp. enterica serovar Weltevreden]
PHNSIRTWDELMKIFYLKYFPPGRMIAMKRKMKNFKMFATEDNADAWRRFKKMAYKCQDPNMTLAEQIVWFYE